jgi:hypothetical protein
MDNVPTIIELTSPTFCDEVIPKMGVCEQEQEAYKVVLTTGWDKKNNLVPTWEMTLSTR